MEEFIKNLTDEQFDLFVNAFMLGRAFEHSECAKTASCEVNPQDVDESVKVYKAIDARYCKMLG